MVRKLGFIMLSVFFLLSFTSIIAWGASSPFIVVDSVPKVGRGDTVSGHVQLEGIGNYGNYRISMALEVVRGGQIWAPKPTADQPTVEINAQGKFSCKFVSGGNDRIAERLYVYLIPASFTPNSDTDATEKAALDTVVIDRVGRLDIRQKNPATLKHPAHTKKLSLNYSPYTEGLSPENYSPISEDHVRRQLALIHPYTDTIRIFGVTGELNKVYKIAKEEFNFRIVGGCWIDQYSSSMDVKNELDALVALVDNGYIDIALVGSEAIFRKDISIDDLVKHIEYVRGKIVKKVPVGTSDVPDTYIDNPTLAKALDVVCCTIYPFFSGIAANTAVQNMAATYARVVNAVNDKSIPVIVSETGWPSEGSPVGAAVPSVANAKKYFEDVYRYSRENDVEIIWFESFSEPWKATVEDYEAHFGLFSSNEELKQEFRNTLQATLDTPSEDTNEEASGCDAVLGIGGFVGLFAVFVLAKRLQNRR